MLRTLKTLLLTAFLAIFATQSSAMFIQPDWFDVRKEGVGTNRYSYSLNDPVNRSDPTGNLAPAVGVVAGIIGLLGMFAADEASDRANDGERNGNGVISGAFKGNYDLGNSISVHDEGFDDGTSDSSGDDSSSGGGTGSSPDPDDDDEPSDKEKQTANHIFGSKNLAKHGLKGLLSKFSNAIDATRAIKDATQDALDSGQVSTDTRGVFSTDVSVQGIDVTVRGRAVNGVAEIGTAFAK
ncbi:hypothetical protein [Leisingera sp. ANG-M7]|uniref:hypothetical protein n=1 Tax=Leisingera sp. ANG-M7 TaxID=1577902 RepID=UPI00126A19F5|nr:hypothetical protein [Leisingera sp. ANG-M7]